MSTTAAYADNGNQPFSLTDERGKISYTHYNPGNGLLNSTVSPKGHTTSYTYDDVGRPLTVSRGGASIQYAYQNGRLSTITSGNDTKNVVYQFLYNAFGNPTQTKVGNQVLASNTYAANNGNLTRTTYGNGQYVEYTYDPFDRITAMAYNGSDQAFTYTYNNKGELWETFDPVNSLRTRFEYDASGRLVRESRSNGAVFTQKYDAKSLANSSTLSYNGTTVEQNRVYQGADLLMRTDFYKNGAKVQDIVNEYDDLSRNYRQTITNRSGAAGGLVNTITYLAGADGGTTDFVQNYAVKTIGATQDLVNYSYTYDADGNIESIKENGVLKATYTYDDRNQLIREDRASVQQTIVYEYDVLGNLTAKKTCAYGTTTPNNTIHYTYGDTNWQDKLTGYNGQAITYDALGNPLSYRDGMSFTWQNGRQLASFTSAEHQAAYTYGADGIRTGKTVDGVTTEYLLNGGDIVMQKTGSDVLWFYGGGFDLNGTRYLYVKNAQGDVTGITDAVGNLVVEYAYDSWGQLLEISGSPADTVGVLNPFRYRGYYYDAESGLYYVQSRYYDPVVGRWINSDGIGLLSYGLENLTQYNMFAYCFNNPTIYYDPTGEFPVVIGIIGLTVATCVNNAVKTGYDNRAYNRIAQRTFEGGYIDEQFKMGQFKMGLVDAARSGCGWIAAYNAMIMLGRPQQPADVIRYFDDAWGNIALGAFGVNPFAMSGYFFSQGFITSRNRTLGTMSLTMERTAKSACACILLYAHSQGAHYIAFQWNGEKYIAHNADSSSFASINGYLQNHGGSFMYIWYIWHAGCNIGCG